MSQRRLDDSSQPAEPVEKEPSDSLAPETGDSSTADWKDQARAEAFTRGTDIQSLPRPGASDASDLLTRLTISYGQDGLSTSSDAKPETADSGDKPKEVTSKVGPRPGLNGTMVSQDGQEQALVISGNIYKADGNFVGHLNNDGQIEQANGDLTPVNNMFDRWTFAGEQDGKYREFVPGTTTTNGTMFMSEAAGGKQTKYNVQMGMLIDATTGEQKGAVTAPTLQPDGSMTGGTVTFVDQDGKPHIKPFSALKNATFELKTMGATGGDEDLEQRILRGVCLGGGPMADGRDNPESGIFSVSKALRVENQRDRLSQRNREEAQASHTAAMATVEDSSVADYMERRLAERIRSEEFRSLYAHQNIDSLMKMVTTGEVTGESVRAIRQRNEVSKSELAANPLEYQRQRLDNRTSVLEQLPEDVKTISGKVLVPAGQGKVETWSINKGEITAPDGKVKGRIESSDGRMVRFDDDGNPVESSMKAMAGAVWNLSYPSADGNQQNPVLISLGESQGMASAADLRHRAFDEHWYAYNANETAGNSKESRATYAEAGANRDRFEQRLNEIMKTGVHTAADLEFLAKGAAEVRPTALRTEKPSTADKIPLAEITAENVRGINGNLRIGNDVYQIRNGDLYKAKADASADENEREVPVGRLHPGYQVELSPGQLTSLADQNRVLMEFTTPAEDKVYRVLGTGAPRMEPRGYTSGGLVDVDELMRQGRQHLVEAQRGNQEYFENRPHLTGGFASWAMGGRDEALRKFAGSVARDLGNLDDATKQLFATGFDTQAVSNSKLDFSIKSANATLHMIGSQAMNTQMLAQEGNQLQHRINDGVYIAATTIATAGIGTGFALLANSSKVAQLGRMGQVLMFAGETGTSALTTGALSAGIRDTDGTDGWSNFKSGALQGLGTGSVSAGNRWLTGGATMAQTGKIFARAEQGLPLTRDQVAILSSVTGRLYAGGHANLARATATGADLLGDAVHAVSYAQADRIRNQNAGTMSAQELSLMLATSRLSHMVGMPLRDATKSDLINAVASGTVNSFSRGAMQEIPRAFAADDARIAKSLGLPVSQLSRETLNKNRDWLSIIAQAGEAGLTSAAMTPFLSSASFGIGRGARGFFARKPEAGQSSELMEANGKPTEKSVAQSNKYAQHDEVSDRIEDGFQQAGARTQFANDGTFNRPNKENYAATVVDRKNDPVLREVIAEAKERFGNLPEKERAEAVSRYAHDLLDGKDIPGSERTRANNTERWQAEFRQENADKRILLGEYIKRGRGVCAEQTLLTKVLADELGLNSTLVRGDKTGGNDLNHSWLKFHFGEGESKIYDPRNQRYGINAGRGYREGSTMTNPNTDVYEATGTSGLGPVGSNRVDPLRVSGLGEAKWEGTKYPLTDRAGKPVIRNGQTVFRNDDDAWVSPNKEVAAAMDGIGGAHGSDVASRIVRERLERNWANFPHNGTEDETRTWLRNSLTEASNEIADVCAKAKAAEANRTVHVYGTRPDGTEMIAGPDIGTTVVATARHGDKVLIASAGDSRVFRLREGKLEQLTADDTNPGAAGNLINNMLGKSYSRIKETTADARPNDRFLIATDGLETLDRDRIRRILMKPGSAQDAGNNLLNAVKAENKPYQDNVTAIVFDVSEPKAPKPVSAPVSQAPGTRVNFSPDMFIHPDEVVVFGRKANIETDSKLVSREQFYMRRDRDGQCYIRDTEGHHNPTYLNGFPVGQKFVPIYPGDEVSVGGPVGGKMKANGQEFDTIKLDLQVTARTAPAAAASNRLKLTDVVAGWQAGKVNGIEQLDRAIASRPPVGQENIINSTTSLLSKTPQLRREFLLQAIQNENYSIEARRAAAAHLAVYAQPTTASLEVLGKLKAHSDPILSALAANASDPQYFSGTKTEIDRALALEKTGLALAQNGLGADVGARFRDLADRIRARAPKPPPRPKK